MADDARTSTVPGIVRRDGNYAGCIWLQDCSRVVIRGATTRNYNGDGISWQICHDVTVESCVSENNAQLGLHPGSGSQRPIIRHNRIVGNDIGIFFCWGVKYGLADQNHLENNRVGISIGHRDTDNLITRNEILRSREVGVLFRPERGKDFAGHRNRLEENRIVDTGATNSVAVDIQGGTEGIILRRNQIEETRDPATFTLDAAAYTVREDAAQLVVRVVRTGALDAGMTVDCATTNGSALAGSDFEAVSGTLTFAEGQTEQAIVVSLLNDRLAECSETFDVKLSNPSAGASLGTPSTAAVRIARNDWGRFFLDPPELRGTTMTLSWSGGTDRWLEQRTNLVSGDWQAVPDSQGQTNLALPVTEGMAFFRTSIWCWADFTCWT